MGNRADTSVTRAGPRARRLTMARRVGSERAAKERSRAAAIRDQYSTTWLSMSRPARAIGPRASAWPEHFKENGRGGPRDQVAVRIQLVSDPLLGASSARTGMNSWALTIQTWSRY